MQEMDDFPAAKAEMLIRRPVTEVFEAFVNPAITSRFWFTKGSGRLEAGEDITWDWEMYDFSVPVKVRAVEENARILVDWPVYGTPTSLEWTFMPRLDGTTFVSVTNKGFPGTRTRAMQHALDATEGFAFVLAGAKAVLECDVELELVRDRFPDGLSGVAEGELLKGPELESSAQLSIALPVKPDDWPRLFEQYLNAGDLDAVIALYEPEARFVAPSGEVLVGHDQMRKVIGEMIGAKTRLRARVVQAVTDDEIAQLSSDFEGTTIDDSGRTVAISSKAIEVLRRQADGSWKLMVGNPHGRE
jgi:uncharacterized protein YndB with AHSA1/START domain/ketosteroid isomerase-like protein